MLLKNAHPALLHKLLLLLLLLHGRQSGSVLTHTLNTHTHTHTQIQTQVHAHTYTHTHREQETFTDLHTYVLFYSNVSAFLFLSLFLTNSYAHINTLRNALIEAFLLRLAKFAPAVPAL